MYTHNSPLNNIGHVLFGLFSLGFPFILWTPRHIVYYCCAHCWGYIRESATPSAQPAPPPPLDELSFLSSSSSSSSWGFTPAASLQTSANGYGVTFSLLVSVSRPPPPTPPPTCFSTTPWRKPAILRRGWSITLWPGDADNVFSTINHNQENLLCVFSPTVFHTTESRDVFCRHTHSRRRGNTHSPIPFPSAVVRSHLSAFIMRRFLVGEEKQCLMRDLQTDWVGYEILRIKDLMEQQGTENSLLLLLINYY